METTAISAPAISDLANGAIDIAETHKARVIAKAKARRIARGDAEAHRLRGIARLQAATKGAPTKILRLEITNVLSGNDYSARLAIGSKGAVANVILDTGSSTLAVEPSVYSGVGDKDLKPTTLLQLITYGTGGWAGPMVDTTLAFGADAAQVVLPNCPIAITTVQESGNFQGVTGIMGLAYNGLNSAFDFSAYLATQGKESTFPWPFGKVWSNFLAGFRGLMQRARASGVEVKPYFDQLEESGVVANKFAFYTLRSWVSMRLGTTVEAVSADPLNKGFFILGGGEEQHDLYTGDFVAVNVLHDLYYNTNLKSVRVDGCPAHQAALLQSEYKATSISNSIVDSGTSDLSLAQDVYDAILQGLEQRNPAFTQAIQAAADSRDGVPSASLDLAKWPIIYFTLEGENGEDVELACMPQTYWQADFPAKGRAAFQIGGPLDTANQSILGLPLMNNYYTVFDRTQDVNGVIRFAKIKALA
ncbi:pepsin-like aspartic protease [Caballeronia sp. KNU42]